MSHPINLDDRERAASGEETRGILLLDDTRSSFFESLSRRIASIVSLLAKGLNATFDFSLNMHTRTATLFSNDGELKLPYYPTRLELLLEDFAKKHGVNLSDAEEGTFDWVNYERCSDRPLNGMHLKYTRFISNDDKYFKLLEEEIPKETSPDGQQLEDITEENAGIHMRLLHDPSIYGEILHVEGDDEDTSSHVKRRNIHGEPYDSPSNPFDLQFFLTRGAVTLNYEDRLLTPQEFQLLGSQFTHRNDMTQEELARAIMMRIDPWWVLEQVLTSVEQYKP